jgi:hypothetical protein
LLYFFIFDNRLLEKRLFLKTILVLSEQSAVNFVKKGITASSKKQLNNSISISAQYYFRH